MKIPNPVFASLCLSLAVIMHAGKVEAQKDPGPRGGAAGAGGAYYTLGSNEQVFFNQALARFMEVDSSAKEKLRAPILARAESILLADAVQGFLGATKISGEG